METLELPTLLRPLRRWWWLVAAATLLATFSSLIYSLRQPAVYTSRTTLIVGSTISNPNPTGTDIYLVQQLASAYSDIAKREPIQASTRAALGIEWLPNYWVQALPNSQMIEIQVFAEDPTLARDVAATLAQQLILLGPAGREQQEREAFIDAQLTELQIGITDTRNEVRQKQQELTSLFSAREIANTQSLIQALENKVSTLQANYAALLATTQNGAANTLSILEPANLPTTPIDSNLSTNVLVGALLGCALAICGAYLIEFLDDSFKTAHEIKEALELPVLTSVPMISGGIDDNKLIMLQTTPVPAMEAYRLLRINLEFVAIDHPIRVLVVAGASTQDGKSLTAANLAATHARTGQRVILIDADLHRPSQQRLFKLTNNIGLTTALRSDEFLLESLVQSTTVPGLQVLTTGPLPPNPAELLGSQRMQEILSRLKAITDLVIIDSPPLATVTDGIVLATKADGVLLVVRAGKTRRANVKRVYHLLQQVKARLLGVVYNGVAANDSEYQSDHGYYSYYRQRKNNFPPPTGSPSPLSSESDSPSQKAKSPEFDLPPQKANGTPPLFRAKRKPLPQAESFQSGEG